MELRNLKYFVVVAEEMNFRRASDRLHVAQSAVSRRIQDLEAELGVQLFEREGKRITLSAAGRAFAQESRRILDELNQATDRVRLIAQGIEGTLRIGLHPSAARHAMVSASFRAFRTAFPKVELVLPPLAAMTQMGAITTGEIDAGYVLSADDVASAEFESLPISSDAWVVAMLSDHPLAHRSSIRLHELATETFVLFPRELHAGLYDRLISACIAGGLRPRVVQHVVSEVMQMTLVGAGLGVSLVIESVKPHVPPNVVLCQIEDLQLPMNSLLVWRRDNRLPALHHYVTVASSLLPATRARG